MLKSFLLLLLIGVITFGATCGGTILIFTGLMPVGLGLIVIGLVILFKSFRYFLGIYFWRYSGISLILGIIISLVGSIIPMLIFTTTMSNAGTSMDVFIPFYVLQIISLILLVYVFHFYRIKSQTETIVTGTLGGDISIIFHNLFGPLIAFFGDKQKASEQKATTTIPQIKTEDPKTTDLMSSLDQADISHISSVIFQPNNGENITLQTENIKRLAVYITNSLKKTVFVPEELRGVYSYVSTYIASDVSPEEFETITTKLEEFVKNGGEVKIEKI